MSNIGTITGINALEAGGKYFFDSSSNSIVSTGRHPASFLPLISAQIYPVSIAGIATKDSHHMVFTKSKCILSVVAVMPELGDSIHCTQYNAVATTVLMTNSDTPFFRTMVLLSPFSTM